MRIYLSTWLTDRSLGTCMTKKRASRRLLSYFFLLEQKITDALLNKYSETGRCDPRKQKT
jgi:hypothetical protein